MKLFILLYIEDFLYQSTDKQKKKLKKNKKTKIDDIMDNPV